MRASDLASSVITMQADSDRITVALPYRVFYPSDALTTRHGVEATSGTAGTPAPPRSR